MNHGHMNQARVKLLRVWYGGSDQLLLGEAVCYNSDHGTAADADASRCNRVERPTTSNNRDFAGVAAASYSARSGGQFIDIYEPGSKAVPVALAVDTVIGAGLLTFTAGQNSEDGGRFYTGKYRGRGSAIPRQTKTAIEEASMAGAWSLAVDGVTLTVASTADLEAGMTVVLVGGEDDATGAVVPGKYQIESITDGTTLVLAESAVDAAPAGAATCTGYIYSGNPVAICDLLDGEESGGVEFISLPNAGGDDTPYMVGGVSYICGGITLAADADVELAQGTLPGDKKAFFCLGTLTTNDFVVDLVTAGVQIDGSTALAEIVAIDAAGEGVFLEFRGVRWFAMDITGATQA
jgi:hypothetical protein